MSQAFWELTRFDGKAVKSCGDFLEIEVEGAVILALWQPDLVGKNVVVTIKPEDITRFQNQ